MDFEAFTDKLNELRNKSYRLQASGGDGRGLIGDELWNTEILCENSPEGQENKAIAIAKLAAGAAEADTDWIECFWCLDSFFIRCLQQMPPKVGLEVVIACNRLYETNNSGGDSFKANWANAALDQCVVWLTSTKVSDEGDNESTVAQVQRICDILSAVAKAGREYEALFRTHEPLRLALSDAMSLLETLKASEGDKTAKDGTIKHLTRLKAMCSHDLKEKLHMLEQSCDPENPSPEVFEDAKKLLSEEKDFVARHALLLSATQGPLTQAALYVLQTRRASPADRQAQQDLNAAGSFIRQLVRPWPRQDPENLEQRGEIVDILKSKGILPLLIHQMAYWARDGREGFVMDCGSHCFIVFMLIAKLHPAELRELLSTCEASAAVIKVIRNTAANWREYMGRMGGAFMFGRQQDDKFDTCGGSCIRLDRLLLGYDDLEQETPEEREAQEAAQVKQEADLKRQKEERDAQMAARAAARTAHPPNAGFIAPAVAGGSSSEAALTNMNLTESK